MNKKFLALGLALAMMLPVFTGCTPTEQNSEGPPVTETVLTRTHEFTDVVKGYNAKDDTYNLKLSDYFSSDKDITYFLENDGEAISEATVVAGMLRVKIKGEGVFRITVTARSGEKVLKSSFSITARKYTEIACLGDSLTYGHSWPEQAYPIYLQSALSAEFTVKNYGQNGAAVTGYGVNGDPATDRNPKYEKTLFPNPDIIVVMLGTNDARGWDYAQNHFEKDYAALIDSYAVNDKDVRILLVTSPETVEGNGFGIPGDVIKENVNPLQKKIAEEKGLNLLDFSKICEDRSYDGILRDDGVHLSEKGARLLAEEVAKKINEMSTAVTAKGAVPEQREKEFDVVLFTGQSNMVGRETSKYNAFIPKGKAYEYKSSSAGLTEVKNPVGETFGEVEVSSGSSIVPQFCSYYVALTGRKIIAVHLARGGRKIELFAKGGAIYNNIVTKLTSCFNYLNVNGYKVGRKFYVMYQGESDTGNTSAEVYKSLYESFHSGVTEAFGFEFGAMIYNGRDTVESTEGIARINGVKKTMAEERDDLIVCDKGPASYYYGDKGLMRGDNVHLNAEGLKRVGANSCMNIVNYLGYGKDKSLAGVDPVTYLEEPSKKPDFAANQTEFEWNFDDGDLSEKNSGVNLTKCGTGTPVFKDGKYVHTERAAVYYELPQAITLSASKNWSLEWKGFSGRDMNGNASVLMSNGETIFITFQNTHGVYVRKGSSMAKFGSSITLEDIYFEHVWKLSYSASAKKIELYEDGVLKGSLNWSKDITLTHLLGATYNGNSNNYYSFVGELDYIKINLG